MAGLFDEWDAKREQRTRPAAGPVQIPELPADPTRAAAYARAALEGEVRNLQAVPVGAGRNDQLNRSALKMFGYVEAGAIDERTVFDVLGAADGGIEYPATFRTLQSAREAARRYGAKPIPQAEPAGTSDDPFSPHFRAALAAPIDEHGEPRLEPAPEPGAAEPVAAAAAPNSDPAYIALVQAEASSQRLRRDARRLVDQEEQLRTFRPPPFLPTLTDELAIPDEPVTYRVDKLLPTGGNVLLAAQFKAGKTTLVSNLTRSLVDGDPFLGQYIIDNLAGRVCIFNYEVSRDQYRRWLRDIGIRSTGRVNVLPLRGFRLPLLTPAVEDWTVEYLKRAECQVWIVDPFARAIVGSVANENDNTEVGAFLDALDVIKERAGVAELILPTHTGRAEHEPGDERARGATRLDDWADVRWLLTLDKNGTRYFRATGRDVDTDEQALTFNATTRHLTATGADRYTTEKTQYRDAVLTIVTNRPGVNARELRDGVRQIIKRAGSDKITDAIDDLIAAGQAHKRRSGHAVGHFPGRDPGVVADPFAA